MLRVEPYPFNQGKTDYCDECSYPPAWVIRQELTGQVARRGLACPVHVDTVLNAIYYYLPGGETLPPAS